MTNRVVAGAKAVACSAAEIKSVTGRRRAWSWSVPEAALVRRRKVRVSHLDELGANVTPSVGFQSRPPLTIVPPNQGGRQRG
jgi:hypothetical protein